MKNQFIVTLSEGTQKAIEKDLRVVFKDLSPEELQNEVSIAMDSRLVDLEDTIDITPYL